MKPRRVTRDEWLRLLAAFGWNQEAVLVYATFTALACVAGKRAARAILRTR